MSTPRYAIPFDLSLDLPAARERLTAALAAEGFGILTEIDVAATLQKKLGVQVEPYVILGACNPRFAHQALQQEEAIGILLPCNVALKQVAPGKTRVWLTRVEGVFGLIDNPAMAKVARPVGEIMERIADRLRGD